jgi:hypothetical protein
VVGEKSLAKGSLDTSTRAPPMLRWCSWARTRKGPPNTCVESLPNEYANVLKNTETRNLRKSVLASKVVNPFRRAIGPPFIGRQRDFYIPKIPSNLKNILSVNMYKNVFCIP